MCCRRGGCSRCCGSGHCAGCSSGSERGVEAWCDNGAGLARNECFGTQSLISRETDAALDTTTCCQRHSDLSLLTASSSFASHPVLDLLDNLLAAQQDLIPGVPEWLVIVTDVARDTQRREGSIEFCNVSVLPVGHTSRALGQLIEINVRDGGLARRTSPSKWG